MRRDILRSVDSRLRDLRKEAHLSQAELSARSGVPLRTIQYAEGGGTMRPTTAAKLAPHLPVKHWGELYGPVKETA